ncbi:MAG: hypothetical protein B0A82_03460 [Alkalinema sp. CACIAM 70d]|nr:MAG: hypothetical protein B0A82_03460 [Alkalinema sp. CACIAM 70d]
MSFTLTPEIEQLIQAQLEAGNFITAEDVILAGLRLLQSSHRTIDQVTIDRERLAELQQEIRIGVEEADRGELIDSHIVFQELQSKLERRHNQE